MRVDDLFSQNASFTSRPYLLRAVLESTTDSTASAESATRKISRSVSCPSIGHADSTMRCRYFAPPTMHSPIKRPIYDGKRTGNENRRISNGYLTGESSLTFIFIDPAHGEYQSRYQKVCPGLCSYLFCPCWGLFRLDQA
jgi:hypothetical protein